MTPNDDALRARVEQAQALAAAATPGPWAVQPDGRGRVLLDHVETGEESPAGWGVPVTSIPRKRAADAEFIAAAPDLAALVADLWAEVERLTAERDTAAAKERAAVVAWLRLGDSWGVLDGYSYGQVADAIEAGDHLEDTRA